VCDLPSRMQMRPQCPMSREADFVLVSIIADAHDGSRTSLSLCFSGLTGASISAPAAASPISWSPFADMCFLSKVVD
jgi:hypothetical protein